MGVTTDRKPLTRTPYHSPRKKQYHIFKKLDADYLAKELETALEKAQEAVKNAPEAKENAATEGGGKYSRKIDVLALENVDWMDNHSSIKQQLQKHADEINEMDPVAVVEYVHNEKESVIDVIMSVLPKIGGGYIKNGKVDFTFDREGAKSINRHATGAELRAAAMASAYVAKYGKLIAGQKNHENTGLTTLTFAAPVIINEMPVNVGVAIQFQENGRPRAVNVGLQDGGKFKINRNETSRGTSSRVDGYRQVTSLDTRDASMDSIPASSEKSNSKFSMKLDGDLANDKERGAAVWDYRGIVEDTDKLVAAYEYAFKSNRFTTGYAVDRQGYGQITFDPNDINYAMNYANTPAEMAAIAALPSVLKRGIEIAQHTNHKNRKKQTITFAAPVELNGMRGNMAAVVNRNGDHYYAHRIVMPNGTAFVFSEQKGNAALTPSRGVTENGSLAETISAASSSSIPASSEKSNTKFSMKLPVEETGTLIALHNLSEEKLRKALQLGGFPMPSIAVTKASIPHTNFGDITLVMDKSTVDPQADRRNTVYSADAWTPTFPETEYEANEKVRSRISKLYYALSGRIGYDATRPLYNYVNDIEREIARAGGESGIIKKERNNTDMMKVFLADRGKAIPDAVTEEQVKRLDDETVSMYDYFIKALGEDAFHELTVKEGQNPREVRKAWWSKHGDAFESVYREYIKTLGFSDEEATNVLENESLAAQTSKALQMRNYLNNGAETRTTVKNTEATKEAIRKAVDSTEYDAWLHSLFDGIVKSTGIYNGSEIYTPSGNRRSFSATHYPVTLENIAKAMAAQNGGNTKNVSGFHGIKTLRAATAKRFASIADMHENEGRLQQLTEEQAEAINDNLSERLTDIMERILESREKSRYDNQFILMDQIGNILTEIADRPKVSIDSVMKAFEKTVYKVGTPIATEIRDFLFDVSQMPVYIFEAKPERAVRFNEVLAAVTPSGTDSELLDALREAGVQNILEYQKDDAQDRIAKVNSVEGAKFSRKLGQNETMEGGTDGSNEGGLLREVSGVLSQNERGDNSTVLGRGAKIAERKQFKRPGDFTEADLRKLTTDFSRLIDGHLSEEGRVLLKAFEQDSHGVDRFAQDVYSSCTNSLAEAELRWMDYIPNIHEVYDAFADAFPGKENEDVKKSRKLLPPTDEAERLDIEVQSKLATLQSELEKAKKRADYWQGQTKRTKEPSVRMEDVRALTRRMLSDFMSTATVGKIAPQVKALADFIVSGHDGTEELTWLGAKARALDIAEQIIGSAWAPKGTDVYGSYIFDAESVYGVSTDELRKHIAGYELYITRGEMEDIADYQIWRKHLPRYIHLHYTEDRRNSNVDTLYNDLRGKYPHVFTQEANTGAEQLQAIIDGVNKLETEYENPYRNVRDKWEEIVANTLIDSVIDESVRQTPPTFADRQARKLLEQQLVSDKRIAKLRADRDKKISDIKKHYRKVAEDKRARRSESEERFSLTKLTKSSMTKMAHRPSI